MNTTLNTKHLRINWDYPPPHNVMDRFVGPGATRAELMLQFVPTAIAALSLIAAAIIGEWGWTRVQLIVAGVLALDMIGGVITNATSSGKRWYHRTGQGFRQHMLFVLIHIVQPTLLVLFFDPGNWAFVAGSYGYLVLASLLILLTPLYLQRPLAGLLLLGGFFLSLYVLPAPRYFEWFLPVFYTKLLSSHLLREEPYRPASEVQP
ncbi:MAG: hypothetical protein ACOCX3_03465 [Chloroflexota bacterium]